MKFPLILGVLAAGLVGCTALKPTPVTAPATAGGANTPAAPPPQPAEPVPVNVQQGRIASVRSELKFVVVDFAPGSLPAIGQRLSVYRGAQKVGELLITGPAEGMNIAADLIEGAAEVGDAVK